MPEQKAVFVCVFSGRRAGRLSGGRRGRLGGGSGGSVRLGEEEGAVVGVVVGVVGRPRLGGGRGARLGYLRLEASHLFGQELQRVTVVGAERVREGLPDDQVGARYCQGSGCQTLMLCFSYSSSLKLLYFFIISETNPNAVQMGQADYKLVKKKGNYLRLMATNWGTVSNR